MLDPTEAAFLRGIAAEGDSDTGRLAFADWLDERGDADRAEFVRVQCALAAGPETQELRTRERALLDARRGEWCEALGLPVEDVRFERGLVSRVRLPEWDGRLLDAAFAPRFATLTELDLSDVNLGDNGVIAIARSSGFPLLRKLILSNTGVSDAGVTALADATGMPRLDTLYLFGNTVSEEARTLLDCSTSFTLGNLDAGERADGYCMSPGVTDIARRRWIRADLWPFVRRQFEAHERLRSATLCVAQYWDDEAGDAVHGRLIVSEWPVPLLDEVDRHGGGSVGDPNLPSTHIQSRYQRGSSSLFDFWDTGVRWFDNSEAIPLWAAFSPEGGHQEYEKLSEAYAPAVMFYRNGGHEVLPMRRPQLDGVRPERGWEE
jgi:uncharacterized protein (TIGR02996 family)